jgi:hypothetical protein
MRFSPEIKIHVEKKKREKEYKEIHDSPRSPFKDMRFKDIFLNAMMLGYQKKIRTPLEGARHDLFEVPLFNPEEEWLIKSVALAEKDNLDVLLDEKEILKITEEYANAGILILYDIIFGGAPGDPLKRIESYIKDILSEVQK